MTFRSVGTRSPQIQVRVDFDTDPADTPRTWTDVTTDVREIAWSRSGRNNELSRSEAGSLTALLDNRAGSYDPFGNPGVKRLRWIEVQASYAGTAYTRFTGLIESWDVCWPGFGADSTAEIRATDTFKALNLYSLEGLAWPVETTASRVQRTLDEVGVTWGIDMSTHGTVVATGTMSNGETALSHLLALEETENGVVFVDGAGAVQFQSRDYRTVNSGTAAATIGDQAGEIPYRDAHYISSDEDIWNSWQVTTPSGTVAAGTAADSISHYWRRDRSRALLIDDTATAEAARDWLLNRYKDPPPRVPSLELVGVAAPTFWPTILGLGNSDRVTWKRHAGYGGPTSDFYVERVSERVSPTDGWTVSLDLSPVVLTSYWLLEDAVYGLLEQTTFLGYSY